MPLLAASSVVKAVSGYFHDQSKMYCEIFVLMYLTSSRMAVGFQKSCEGYLEGFSLPRDYNLNIAPKENVTIFAMQHVEDVVKVKYKIGKSKM